MCLEYNKMHTYPNDCVLYGDEFVALKVCPTCELSQLKKKPVGSSDKEEIEDPLLRCCGIC